MLTLASHHECFPVSVMEALVVPACRSSSPASGPLPVVVRGGVDGVLVPPGDSAALAGALRSVVADEAGRAAMREAGARLKIRAASVRLEGLYLSSSSVGGARR